MIRYRIIHKDIVCDGMLYNDALEALIQFQNAHPDNDYDVEEYNFVPPAAKRYGRDPDLH